MIINKSWFSKWFILCTILSLLLAFSSSCTNNYRLSKEDSYFPYSGSIDIYSASREELIELDLCDYPKAFGKVESEKEAAQIAAEVIKEVYENDESPYIVKFNENADAWIVHGSLPWLSMGGVASVAIDRESGDIIMMLHTK